MNHHPAAAIPIAAFSPSPCRPAGSAPRSCPYPVTRPRAIHTRHVSPFPISPIPPPHSHLAAQQAAHHVVVHDRHSQSAPLLRALLVKVPEEGENGRKHTNSAGRGGERREERRWRGRDAGKEGTGGGGAGVWGPEGRSGGERRDGQQEEARKGHFDGRRCRCGLRAQGTRARGLTPKDRPLPSPSPAPAPARGPIARFPHDTAYTRT